MVKLLVFRTSDINADPAAGAGIKVSVDVSSYEVLKAQFPGADLLAYDDTEPPGWAIITNTNHEAALGWLTSRKQIKVVEGSKAKPGDAGRLPSIPEVVTVHQLEEVQERNERRFEELSKANAQLSKQLLTSPLLKKGTTTYAQYYDKYKPDHVAPEKLIISPSWSNVEIKKAPKFPGRGVAEETEMQPAMWEAFKDLEKAKELNAKMITVGDYLILDTHTNKYLEGCAPDITVVQRGSCATSFNCVFIIELQAGTLHNAHRGKAINYGASMLSANPDRTAATVVLTNTEECEIFTVSHRQPEEPAAPGAAFEDTLHLQVASMRMTCADTDDCKGWRWIVGLLLSPPEQLGYRQADIKLGVDLVLPVQGFLGGGRQVKVYVVKHEGKDKVAKQYSSDRGGSFGLELIALRDIRSHADRPPGLPVLEAHHNLLLVTTPVVSELGTVVLDRTRLDGLMTCLRFLHLGVRVVHRDIEPRHVGLCGQLIQLIDLSCAVPLSPPYSMRMGYRGTLMFASNDVLDALEARNACEPHYRQDLVAVVKTVYAMCFPTFHAELRQLAGELEDINDVKERISKVRRIWQDELGQDSTWQEVLSIAAFEVLDDQTQIVAEAGEVTRASGAPEAGEVTRASGAPEAGEVTRASGAPEAGEVTRASGAPEAGEVTSDSAAAEAGMVTRAKARAKAGMVTDRRAPAKVEASEVEMYDKVVGKLLAKLSFVVRQRKQA